MIDVGINVVQPPGGHDASPANIRSSSGSNGGSHGVGTSSSSTTVSVSGGSSSSVNGSSSSSSSSSSGSRSGAVGDLLRGCDMGGDAASAAACRGAGQQQQAKAELDGKPSFEPGTYHVVGDVAFEEVSQVSNGMLGASNQIH